MLKKKRKLRNKILIILGILILLGIYFLYQKNNTYQNTNEDIIKDKKQEYQLSLVMVGDALINDLLYNSAKIDNSYNFKPYLRLIKERIKSYNLKYYNQETILGGSDIGVSSYPAFNSPYEVGDAMIDTGFNIVSLATNHTLDRGKQAIINSRNYWNNQDNVIAIGSYKSIEEKNTIENRIYEENHIKYGILNYTYGTNGISIPNNEEYLVNIWPQLNDDYKDVVLRDINNLRDKVDVLMVAMHWGIEYTHTPTEKQREIAKFLANNGVDIIIGTHPHVIEPIEFIDNTLVFYSLGNFISSQTSESCTNYKCNIGLLSSLTITKTIEDNISSIKIDNIENDLIYTYNNSNNDYLVIPFSNKDINKYLDNYEEIYNTYANIIKSHDERIKLIPLEG